VDFDQVFQPAGLAVKAILSSAIKAWRPAAGFS